MWPVVKHPEAQLQRKKKQSNFWINAGRLSPSWAMYSDAISSMMLREISFKLKDKKHLWITDKKSYAWNPVFGYLKHSYFNISLI